MRRVVIVGMGIVSSIGNNSREVLRSLRDGRSGIEFIPERKELGFRSALGGTIRDLSPLDIPKRTLRQMGRGSYLATHAVLQALENARLSRREVQNEQTGLIIGNMGNMRDAYDFCHKFHVEGKNPGGIAYSRAMASSVTANLSVFFGIQGNTMTVSAACASGGSAIGQAFLNIRFGLQNRYLCGGVQEDSWQSICLFDAMRNFSIREHEPTKASRPFDTQRDGLVPSCGSGFVVIEEYELARARGAHIYAELIGYGTVADGYNMTLPSGTGSIQCIKRAIQDAGIEAEDIDYINAHATSTSAGDSVEAHAIAQVFGQKPNVSSTKSITGHELGAAGSNELIYTLLMMEHGFIAPNINLDEIDKDCLGINIVANRMIEKDLNIAMSNSFGFGGVNTCLIIGRVV
ncbi:MAG: hypothetical protein BA863_18200 [Desulfovibrio sp. S3730MH75]|nr:MAG: hypothetical protein BA863_18200 [Desulfovibrio sp. S3730MH75]